MMMIDDSAMNNDNGGDASSCPYLIGNQIYLWIPRTSTARYCAALYAHVMSIETIKITLTTYNKRKQHGIGIIAHI